MYCILEVLRVRLMSTLDSAYCFIHRVVTFHSRERNSLTTKSECRHSSSTTLNYVIYGRYTRAPTTQYSLDERIWSQCTDPWLLQAIRPSRGLRVCLLNRCWHYNYKLNFCVVMSRSYRYITLATIAGRM